MSQRPTTPERQKQIAQGQTAARIAARAKLKIALGDEAAEQFMAIADDMGLDGPKELLDRAIEMLKLLHKFHKLESKVYVAHKDGSCNELKMFAGIADE
jgi:hypothetical protein